jgi:hypothetical protein
MLDIFKDKKYPKWFIEHPIFNDVKEIKKVFPSIGLSNSETEIDLDNGQPALKSAITLIAGISKRLKDRKTLLQAHSKKELNIDQKAKIDRCINILSELVSLLSKKNQLVSTNNGRVVIKLPKDLILKGEEKPIFRAEEGLFRVYNKLNDLHKETNLVGMPKLESLRSFKTFSAENIPNNKFKIVFSSNGKQGAWDIATMSMRGVSSCQSWTGQYSHCLIGSVLDPFVGIIYLTSGNKYNAYGSKMIKRSIVRFVINEETKKPYLLMDNIYPSEDKKIVEYFISFLKEKTNNKFDVVYGPTSKHELIKNSYLPLTPIRKKLAETNSREDDEYYDDLSTLQSYQDLKIKNKKQGCNDKHSALFEKNSKKKADKFVQNFSAALSTAIDNVDKDNLSDKDKFILEQLSKKYRYNYSYVVPEIGRALANSIVKSVDKKDFLSSKTYAKRLYYKFFTNKDIIIDGIKSKIAKDINGKLQLRKFEQLDGDRFIELLKLISNQIDASMKESFKEFTTKKKIKPLPLP